MANPNAKLKNYCSGEGRKEYMMHTCRIILILKGRYLLPGIDKSSNNHLGPKLNYRFWETCLYSLLDCLLGTDRTTWITVSPQTMTID